MRKLKFFLRDIFINYFNRRKLNKSNISLLSSNCNGGFILHDLKYKFCTPTINLYMNSYDFVRFLENLDYYMTLEVEENKESHSDYPIGRLGDLTIHFMHYKNFTDAREKWNQRISRLDMSNLYIMMTDRDGCTIELIKKFDKLPFKNKVIFTHKEYCSIKSAFYIKGFEDCSEVGELSQYVSKWSLKRYYDQFDYVKWFNS